MPRRAVLAQVVVDRRRRVDPRRGAERRSTLDRRNRAARPRSTESPAEHLRNALQLLDHLNRIGDLPAEQRADLAAALRRLESALQLLEHHPSP